MPASGKRTVSVIVKRRVVTKGASGAPVETWVTLRSVMASKEDLPMNDSREQMQGSQLAARMETAWGLPYTADTDPDLVDVARERRILYGSRVYDIVRAMREDSSKRGIILYTRASVG